LPRANKLRIEWLRSAIASRRKQLAYVAESNPQAAIEIGSRIDASLLRLTDHPEIGRKGRIQDTRELPIAGTPFIIVYRIEPDALLVMRILHHARSWPPKDA
jgi:toxin ParE1/3/4